MPTYRITGGKPLYGSVRVGGAKNASYKLMIAALLADTPSRILNFSHILDVKQVASIITSLGATAKEVGERAYVIDPRQLAHDTIDGGNGALSRASTMFIPALLHRFGRAIVPFPGGDKIGARPLERHFQGLEALGAKITVADGMITAVSDGLVGTTYTFEKCTHTGTETLILAAVNARGTTILKNCALEPEIDDLIAFLVQMGAQITRKPDRVIEIVGVPHLAGAIHKIMPDQNQVVSFACAALATKGDIVVENAHKEDIGAFLEALDRIHAGYEVGSYGIRFFTKGALQATDIETAVHPGFKTDWQPLWVTMMTQAVGVSSVHETVQQHRFQYVDALISMGASIALYQPNVENPDLVYNFNLHDETGNEQHAVKITGPSALQAGEFEVRDLRHGATLMIAGCVASGTTILKDPADHIGRGYEHLDQQFVSMGADITREE